MFSQTSDILSKYSTRFQKTKIEAIKNELLNLKLDFSRITISDINRYCGFIDELYANAYNEIGDLKYNAKEVNFKNAVQPLIDLDIYIAKAQSLCTFPQYSSTDKELRDKSAEAMEHLENLAIKYQYHERTYQVLKKYEANNFIKESKSLDSEEIILFKNTMDQYKRNGLEIEEKETKEEVLSIKKKITELTVQFDKNLGEDTTSFEFKKNELEGLPKSWFTKEREIKKDIYKVTLKYPDVFPVLDYANNRKVREKIYTAFQSRCEKENMPILKELLFLRQKLSSLLGFESHAEFATHDKLLKNPAEVNKFLSDMNKKFEPLIDKNIEDLEQFARVQTGDLSFKLYGFDVNYYKRLREEKHFNINVEELREYFPYHKVISGTLQIYQDILGLKFEKYGEAKVWHEDVMAYKVYNNESGKSKELLGEFYLDLYPREGKFTHAAMFPLVLGCDVSSVTKSPNSRDININAMLCNFEKGKNVSFEDAVTFFHEFGHVMHMTCSKTKLAACHADHVEGDFIEAPSQMLENWCYDARVLKLLSEHSETKKPLPEEIALKLKQKANMHAGYTYKRQLLYGIFDYSIYCMNSDELQKLNIKKYFKELQKIILKIDPIKDSCQPASFAHTVSGNDAGYYGYLLSETYCADMYKTHFKENPLSKTAGMKYRKQILEPGSSKTGMELLKNFLGREPSIEPFIESLGLEKELHPVKKKQKLALKM